MNRQVSNKISRQSGGHSGSGGAVSMKSISMSRFSSSRVCSAVSAARAWIAASPGSTTSSDSTLGTLDMGTDIRQPRRYEISRTTPSRCWRKAFPANPNAVSVRAVTVAG